MRSCERLTLNALKARLFLKMTTDPEISAECSPWIQPFICCYIFKRFGVCIQIGSCEIVGCAFYFDISIFTASDPEVLAGQEASSHPTRQAIGL